MKGFNFFDRQSRKTLEGLVAAHLSNQYHLPPRAAQTLCEDALVFGRLWGAQTRAPGQILFHSVAVVLYMGWSSSQRVTTTFKLS